MTAGAAPAEQAGGTMAEALRRADLLDESGALKPKPGAAKPTAETSAPDEPPGIGEHTP